MNENEKKEFYPLYRDAMIKNLLGTNKNKIFLIDFLESFYNMKTDDIKNLKILNSVVLDKETVLSRKFELDIKVELMGGSKINIEMQRKYDEAAEDRLFSYLAGMFYTELKVGEDTSKIKPAMSIVLTKNLMIHRNNKIMQEFYMTNFEKIEDKMLAHKFKTVIIDVEDDCECLENDRFKKWIKFIRANTAEEQEEVVKGDPILENAKKESDRFMSYEYVQDLAFQERMLKWEEEERERLRKEKEKEREEQREKEFKKKIEEGIKEGLNRGIKQGEFNEKCKLAKLMHSKNESLEKIVLYTNLSESKLKDILGNSPQEKLVLKKNKDTTNVKK